MLHFTPIATKADIRQILTLQAINLASNITPKQIAEQGFLTVQHDQALLQRMNELEQGIIIKHGSDIAGYILAMSKELRHDIPILIPMFNIFDELNYDGKRLDQYRYIVVGQVCIAEEYRGRGTFDQAYQAYKALLSPKYDFAITEISSRNLRSIRAHQRVGFEFIHEFEAPDGENWQIVIWDWHHS